MDSVERGAVLRAYAREYAEAGLAVVTQEYPNDLRHTMTGPDDRPRPREIHPAFYGSFDWHSCVEMHWMLVRLLRLAPELVPADRVRATLDAHLTADALAAEAAYLAARPGFKRPYGWGWALMLTEEATTLGATDPDAARWAANLAPLAGVIAGHFRSWLPRADYPSRYGAHDNGAIGLALGWDHAAALAAAGDGTLLATLREAAIRWFGADAGYPAGWEPNGADFLSPALVEAEVMSRALPAAEFAGWLDRFLPGLASGEPASLLTPATVSDPTDGQIAHLHGLNLSRSWAWRRLAAALPPGDPRIALMLAAAARHAHASLDQATGGPYLTEHWLACYAVLCLT
jgi:hypothetical protein